LFIITPSRRGKSTQPLEVYSEKTLTLREGDVGIYEWGVGFFVELKALLINFK